MAGVEAVPDAFDAADGVGQFEQLGRGIAPGEDDDRPRRRRADGRDDVARVEQSEGDGAADFVEHHHADRRIPQIATRQIEAARGGFAVDRQPGRGRLADEAAAAEVDVDRGKALERVGLAGRAVGLDEVDEGGAHAMPRRPQDEPQRGGGLALAVAGQQEDACGGGLHGAEPGWGQACCGLPTVPGPEGPRWLPAKAGTPTQQVRPISTRRSSAFRRVSQRACPHQSGHPHCRPFPQGWGVSSRHFRQSRQSR